MEMKLTFRGGSRIDSEFEGFRIETDQPAHKGGTGTAPAPFDYFLASIGTCAGFYVVQFLEQRRLSTEGLSMTLSTTRDPETRMVSEIVLSVELPADFPPRYRQAIVKAIGQCAVKRHLEHPPAFRTEVAIGEKELAAAHGSC